MMSRLYAKKRVVQIIMFKKTVSIRVRSVADSYVKITIIVL